MNIYYWAMFILSPRHVHLEHHFGMTCLILSGLSFCLDIRGGMHWVCSCVGNFVSFHLIFTYSSTSIDALKSLHYISYYFYLEMIIEFHSGDLVHDYNIILNCHHRS